MTTAASEHPDVLTSMDQLPAGTSPARYVMQEIDPLYFERLVDRDAAMNWACGKLAHALSAEHHVILRLAPEHQVEPFKAANPNAHLVVACTLRAIPGKTPFIVIRPGPDLPEGWLPADLDGYWRERDGMLSIYPIRFVTENSVTSTATSSGRVEIREDGAVAEVYEVTRD